jgi:hypothetical protein
MYVMLSGMFAMYEHPLFILLPTYSLLAIVLKPCDICNIFYNLSILE